MRMICEDASIRLDVFLGRRLRLSRIQSRRLLQDTLVRVNGRPVTGKDKGRLLMPGDRVEVASFEHPSEQTVQANAALPLDILTQGNGWIIVDKPAGTAVHPLRPTEQDTVLNALAARYPQLVCGRGIGEGGLRSGIVHRLDRGTSGVLLVALTEPSWQRLRDAFRKHRMEKSYFALVHGHMPGEGHERMTLAITQHRPARVRVVAGGTNTPSGTRACTLSWCCVRAFDQASLLEVRLGTGFLHQIRAMCAHLGHPLLGDHAYGGSDIMRDHRSVTVARPMLHAHRLILEEPEEEKIDAQCDPPADFQQLLDIMDQPR